MLVGCQYDIQCLQANSSREDIEMMLVIFIMNGALIKGEGRLTLSFPSSTKMFFENNYPREMTGPRRPTESPTWAVFPVVRLYYLEKH